MIKNTSKKTNYESNPSHDPLNQYMKEINEINLLSREEARGLESHTRNGS